MLRLHQAGEPRRSILRSPLALVTFLPLLLGLTSYASSTGHVYDAFDILRDPRGRRPNTFVERMNPDAPVRTFADCPRYAW